MSRKDTCRPRRRQPAWVFIQGAALLLLTILSLGLKVASGQAASLKDFYALLEVNPDATETEVKKAYRKLAQVWHPDKNPNDKEAAAARFAEIAEAYEVLSNPEKRREYDAYREQEAYMAAQGPEDHYYYPQGHGRPAFFETAGWGFRDPFDLFAEMFGDFMPGGYWEEEQADPDAVVYEEEERYELNGREYVRTKRLYGDGSTEVVTRELGPVHGRGSKSGARRRQADADEGLHRGSKRHHQQPARPTAPPSASIFGDHSDRGEGKAARSGQGSLGGRRIGLWSNERLEAGDVLLSRGGTYAARIDAATHRLLVVKTKGRASSRSGVWGGSWGGDEDEGESVVWDSSLSSPPSDATPRKGHMRQLSAPFLTLTPLGRLELRAGPEGRVLLWSSSEEGRLSEDAYLHHHYVAMLDDETGNLCVFMDTRDERECVWASLGCEDDGSLYALWRKGYSVLGPFVRRCTKAFCAIKERVVQLPERVRPELRRGVRRLQKLMKKAAGSVVQGLRQRLFETPSSSSSS